MLLPYKSGYDFLVFLCTFKDGEDFERWEWVR